MNEEVIMPNGDVTEVPSCGLTSCAVPDDADISLPMMQDYIEDNIILLDTSDVCDIGYDADAFQRGVDAMSEFCGKITALVNVGLTPSMALSYLAGSEESKNVAAHNLEVSKISANASVESAKYGAGFATKMSV